MVLTPNEARDRYLESNAATLERIEEKIDGILARSCSETTTIEASDIGNGVLLEEVLLEEIIKRYRTAGWVVKKHYDPGDMLDSGYHYYEFRVPKNT